MTFKPVDPKVNFVEIEKKWLAKWQESNLLEKYLQKNKNSSKKFFFLDGPITANNPMGVHHAWGRTYKDLWQRFKNMCGFKQTFRNGFDNQGLWVEVEVEKKLNFKTKKDIENFGIEKFVNACKESTLHWAAVQTKQSQRLGYFMDWDNSYFTMSEENNYTIWYFLKKCHERGLIYKGRDSVPWCPRCGTAISQHEILQEEYQLLTHESVYFALPIVGKENENFLVWTTTPWTLPANVALAVNPNLEYWLVASRDNKNYWLVGNLVKSVFEKENPKIIKKAPGGYLIGLYYEGPFDSFPAVLAAKKQNPQTFHKVVESEELVSAEEGTGIVHLAPGCGQEDFALGKKENLSTLPAIDESAFYLEGFGDLTGKNAKQNPDLVLKHPLFQNFIFKIKPYSHRYPICWRCHTELVWRVVDEWYIKMDPLREPLKNAARQARWIPEWGLDREIDWLTHMSDWLISKKRYWGLALPIWECPKCGHFEVIGSKEELKEKAVEGFSEFEGHSPHRPWLDKVKIKCSFCQEVISRIPDVGNPWLDAGIVPFSTLIDPKTKKVSYLTDKKYFNEWFPADFITECFPGQFKNWFYSILAMSTVLENRAPFKVLLGHALVKDEKGEEMHKSKGNAIWFDDAAEKMGVDVMRWIYVTQNPEINLNFGYRLAEETRRRFHLVLWNIYNFFVTYANIDKFDTKLEEQAKTNVLDKWILSKLNNLIRDVTNFLEDFNAYKASLTIETFVNDLSTWYIRRSRDRVGLLAERKEDKISFYQTTYHVLLTLSKILAPFIPFLSEEIFTNLSGKESVHLQDWPKEDPSLIDNHLEEEMEIARKIVEAGHSARKAKSVKVRQPLAKVLVKNVKVVRQELQEIIKEELNVKKIEIIPGTGEISAEFDWQITPQLKDEGEARELIRLIQEKRKEAGCALDEKIKLGLPSWPKSFEEEIKRKTLCLEIFPSDSIQVIRQTAEK